MKWNMTYKGTVCKSMNNKVEKIIKKLERLFYMQLKYKQLLEIGHLELKKTSKNRLKNYFHLEKWQ
jgi:sulfur transfer protein SufE